MTSIVPTLATTLDPLVLTTTTANPYPNTPDFIYAFDFFFAYLVAPICFFGVITNLLNIIVFSNNELKEDTYKYLKMNAFSNLIYLFICGLVFTKRCGQFCVLDKAYLTQVYYWIFYIYIKGIFAIFSVCIQILVSLLRLSILVNKKFCPLPNYRVTTILLLIFSAIFYSPNLFTKQIIEIPSFDAASNTTTYAYSVVNNDIGKSELGKTLIIIIAVARSFIAAAMIVVINVISRIKLGVHLEKKSKMKGRNKVHMNPDMTTVGPKTINNETVTTATVNMPMVKSKSDKVHKNKQSNAEDKASRNLTRMVIISAFLYIIGNVPNSIGYILLQYIPIKSDVIQLTNIIANASLFSTQGMDIFVYYFFNKKYNAILRNLMGKVFCFKK